MYSKIRHERMPFCRTRLLALLIVLAFAILPGACKAANSGNTPSISSPADGMPRGNAAPSLNPAEESGKYPDAPDFRVKAQDSQDLALTDLKGKAVIVNFWASWCGPCRMEFPEFQAFYDAHKDEDDFALVPINLTQGRESREQADAFIEQNQYTMPYYYDMDGSAGTAYGTYAIPCTFAIDAEGRMVQMHRGVVNAKMLEEMLQKARGQSNTDIDKE